MKIHQHNFNVLFTVQIVKYEVCIYTFPPFNRFPTAYLHCLHTVVRKSRQPRLHKPAHPSHACCVQHDVQSAEIPSSSRAGCADCTCPQAAGDHLPPLLLQQNMWVLPPPIHVSFSLSIWAVLSVLVQIRQYFSWRPLHLQPMSLAEGS